MNGEIKVEANAGKETGTVTTSIKVVIDSKDPEKVTNALVKLKNDLEKEIESPFELFKHMISMIETLEINERVAEAAENSDRDYDGDMTADSDTIQQFTDALNNLRHKINSDENNSKEFEQHTLDESTVDVDTIITLYRECERAKADFGKYIRLMDILKDIINDEYIKSNGREIINAKIRECEVKVTGLKTAYERLINAIANCKI